MFNFKFDYLECQKCYKFAVLKDSTSTRFDFYLNSGIYRILQDYNRINEKAYLISESNELIKIFDEIVIPTTFEELEILENKINKLLTFQ